MFAVTGANPPPVARLAGPSSKQPVVGIKHRSGGGECWKSARFDVVRLIIKPYNVKLANRLTHPIT